jgi:hypothetical protein
MFYGRVGDQAIEIEYRDLQILDTSTRRCRAVSQRRLKNIRHMEMFFLTVSLSASPDPRGHVVPAGRGVGDGARKEMLLECWPVGRTTGRWRQGGVAAAFAVPGGWG